MPLPEVVKEEGEERKWYAEELESVLEELDTSPDSGLSGDEARLRLERFGENRLPEPSERSVLMRFLVQFHNVLIYVLIIAAVITALIDHWIDTWIILGVVIINAVVGFIQEGKAERALEGIKNMLSLKATVLRDGERREVDASGLVPGDIVVIRSGDKVPADMRVIVARNLTIDESSLTGESEDVVKSPGKVSSDAFLGDRTNMAYSGTAVTRGSATGVVTATGGATEIGRINRMISEVRQVTTPLLQQIGRFGIYLSLAILVVTASFFLFGYFFRTYGIDELFMAAIGIAVAAIPEGLPAIMTIALAIGVQRMAGRNAIIRRLPSVETLGTVSVICSDKTGTLTRNEMTAQYIVTADARYDVDGVGYNPEGAIRKDGDEVTPGDEPVLLRLLQCVRACNDSTIGRDDGGNWTVIGTHTEGALVALAGKARMDDLSFRRLDTMPFESGYKYMATLNEVEGATMLFAKGAPERLLERCEVQMSDSGEEPIDRDFWGEAMESLAGQGQRIIAAAFRPMVDGTNSIGHGDLDEGLIFLGLVGIIDPPRPEAAEAVRKCRKAGITVKMITGDHALTAKAVGATLGIGDGEKVITGAELEAMDNNRLRSIVMDYDVFARTSPEHKLRLVQALQANSLLCAMTGDGINDAPALKQADIGIAMGIKGTEVTREASEMVLADDNFASIVHAVEEGRTVYDNLRKALLFILPTSGAASLVIMAAIFLGIVLPITPVQILWVNMVTTVTLALALSFEPMERKVMERPPREPDEPLLGGYFMWRIAFVSCLICGLVLLAYTMMRNGGADIAAARTIAVNGLVAGQLFYLFNCRKMYESSFTADFFNNRIAFIAAGALVVLQIAFTYLPVMNTLFGSASPAVTDWLYPVAIGIVVALVVEIEKYLYNRLRRT
ncbi:MAG: cation-transporting P-type ATPase [Syntrophales bacterium]|jgi:potassium/sodium efflux P-type ATPase|nr:cation-transporting P-type ATPase [Syntrophales bacterium]MCK9528602.1 cation-transporting P-type ATPase [Syntrophales bacterium]MDX9923043.1 cation-transporting P-type ATPase [Syntrophales bacterium]